MDKIRASRIGVSTSYAGATLFNFYIMRYYFIVDNGVNLRIEPIESDYISVQKFGKSKVYVVSEKRLYEMYKALDSVKLLNLN